MGNLFENLDDIETATTELDGIAAQLNCIAYSLSSRNGKPAEEILEKALLAIAEHISRISDDITNTTAKIMHRDGEDEESTDGREASVESCRPEREGI